MTQAIDSIWNALKKADEIYAQNNSAFKIEINTSDEKKAAFKESFEKLYQDVKDKYMRHDVAALDRHKVAAITICTIINEDIVMPCQSPDADNVFLGAEMIALSIGLSYMQRSLNDVLKIKGIPKTITGYSMPVAMACRTDYFDILARNLYFSKKDYVLNPLDIADKLFLVEYLTLKEEMIDPKILIES